AVPWKARRRAPRRRARRLRRTQPRAQRPRPDRPGAPRAENRLARVAATTTARSLFAPLGPTYDRYSALLSFGQDPRWRRFLVSRLDVGADDTVLDVATGTGMVARELVRLFGCSVVGLDQSPEMLAVARDRTHGLPVTLVEGRAESLPFADDEFASLTF